ncbi:hypothetical protein SVEN_0724 [Streptomyces venezuelae ATCC 10712]|uniref:Uncharacterized protein n=1 Tax=Streptomyces venezuelae (strain ATCC 10712 / CBS 650.69 / DSM 40230 / JCM 4526 / NBRC 13096 / PD 04745) TaxID=953739 RepID=F2R9R1_STRVP|nr:hypothetical protein SVEN_0724 [Streptomyces venezuelae ATCC 10712]
MELSFCEGGMAGVRGSSDARTARARVAGQVHVGPAVEKEFWGHSVRVTIVAACSQVRTVMWEECHGVRPPAPGRR